MTVGMCSCEVGKDGSPCKQQYVLWSANLAHCLNFVPISQPEERQKWAWIAIGESLPLSRYKNLRDQDDHLPVPETSNMQIVPPVAGDIDSDLSEEPMQNHDHSDQVQPQDDTSASVDMATELLKQSCEQITEKLRSTRDPNLVKGVIKFSKRVMNLAAATAMH